MSLKTTDVVKDVQQHGLRWTIISIICTLGLGIVDQFTSRIIPSIVQAVDNRIDPPKFFVSFTTPVNLVGDVSVSGLGASTATSVKINRVGERGVAAIAGPGAYELRLRRERNQVLQELVDTKLIEKTNQVWQVDTSDRNWANAAELRASNPNTSTPVSGSTRLTATRWTVAEPDFAVLASVQNPTLRLMLANALAEVGILENGTEYERGRINAYWEASGRLLPPGTPWGGAFMAWVTKQAGIAPPEGAASFLNWLDWNEEGSTAEVAPGTVAVYRLDQSNDIPQSRSRMLVGTVLRRQPDCIETILGNIADRVVISCVASNLLVGVRRPSSVGNGR